MSDIAATLPDVRRPRLVALATASVAAVLCIAGVGIAASGSGSFDPTLATQFYRSYLLGYVFWTGISVGCLAILMLQHLSGGAWGLVVRRGLEAGAGTLPLMAFAFLPLIPGLETLYPWARPDAVAADPILQHKSAYLNVSFFLLRTAFYFAVWLGLAICLRRWSLQQDRGAETLHSRARVQQVSGIGLGLCGLTLTFAAIDWVMSLEPHWFSSLYGGLFIMGAVLGAFALIIALTALVAGQQPLAGLVRPSHFHDLGKLLFAFVMLWAYFAFSQYLIIWSGNLPEEIPWILHRTSGGWQSLALAIVVFHFAFPFVLLLSRDIKRNPRLLATIAAAIVFMRFADLFWMMAPEFYGPHWRVHWLDIVLPAGIGGLWLGLYFTWLAARPLLPLSDPALADLHGGTAPVDHGEPA